MQLALYMRVSYIKNMLTLLAEQITHNPKDLEIHPEYIGYMVRNDGWSIRNWDRGDGWSVLYFLERGEIRIHSEDDSFVVTPGDSLFIGGQLHPDVAYSNPIELREVWFRFNTPPELVGECSVLSEMIRFRCPVEAASLVDFMTSERQALKKVASSEMLLPLRMAMLLALCEQEIERGEEAARKLSPSQRVRLVRWVRQNLAERPSPARVADMLGLSPDYFGRIFRNTFGQAPRDWLIRQRIMMARRLLDEGVLSRDDVMQQCGFDDVAHFSRQMKRLTGKTPGGSRGWTRNKR